VRPRFGAPQAVPPYLAVRHFAFVAFFTEDGHTPFIVSRNKALIRVWYPLPCPLSQASTSASMRIVSDFLRGR